MRKETFVLTTSSDSGSHTELWDSSRPKALGHPFKWVLENTKDGVRLRNIGGGIGKLQKDVTVHISDHAIDKHEYVSVPAPAHDEQHPLRKVKLVRVNAIHPPYMHQGEIQTPSKDSSPHLLAFAGLRRAIISSQEVRSSYIAYAKEKPVFSFNQVKDKITIKPLINEVQLKKKGQAPQSNEEGAVWTLTQEELLECTIIRGIYWWKFNIVNLPKALEKIDEESELKPIPFYKTSPFILSALFLLLTISIQLIPTPEKTEEPKEAPVVQLKFAKNKVNPALFGNQNQQSMLPEVESAPTSGNQAAAGQKQTVVEAQTQKLKNAFKGLSALASKNNVKNIETSESKSNIFDSKNAGTSVAKTEVKPLLSGTNAKVSGIGGGTGAGGDNAAVGYGSGKLGSASSGKGDFVGLDSAGSSVDEGLTKDEVGAVIHKHMNEVRFCHEAALVVNPKVQGKLNVNFTIGPDGRVKKADAPASDLHESKLDQCIINHLKTWQFPKPRGGVNVGVSYPFIFKTLGKE